MENIGINLILGAGLITYGVYMLIARQIAPEKIKKLQYLKQNYSAKMAQSIHIIGYTVTPIIAGALMVFPHLRNSQELQVSSAALASRRRACSTDSV